MAIAKLQIRVQSFYQSRNMVFTVEIITVYLENETAAEPCLREPPQAVIMQEIARYRSASEEAGKPYTKGAEWH